MYRLMSNKLLNIILENNSLKIIKLSGKISIACSHCTEPLSYVALHVQGGVTSAK